MPEAWSSCASLFSSSWPTWTVSRVRSAGFWIFMRLLAGRQRCHFSQRAACGDAGPRPVLVWTVVLHGHILTKSFRGINMQLSGSAQKSCRWPRGVTSLPVPDRGDVTQIVSELDKTGDGGGCGGGLSARWEFQSRQCAQAKSASTSSWRPANVLGETASG